MIQTHQRHWLSSGFHGSLILDDANTVAHVTFNGSALVDTFGNTWTQNGTVPQVAKAGKTPAGAGPFSDANYYGLGTGNDVLDFAGDFTVHVVFDPPTSLVNTPTMVGNSNATPNTGWMAQLTATGTGRAWNNGTFKDTTNAAIQATVNVLSFGRSGGNMSVKMNLGSTVSGAATLTAATTSIAKIGRFENVGLSWGTGGVIYEVSCTSSAFDEASVALIRGRVRSRALVTAW